MFTQCQYCDFRFEVDIVQLRATSGVMNCSQCNKEFNAIDTLYDEKSTPASEANKKIPKLNGQADHPQIDHVLNDEFIVSTDMDEPEWVDISIQRAKEWNIEDEVRSILDEENKTVQYSPLPETEKNQQLPEKPSLVESENDVQELSNSFIESRDVESDKDTKEPGVVEFLPYRPDEKENIKKTSELEALESFLKKVNEDENVEKLFEPNVSESLLEKQNREENAAKTLSGSDSNTVWWSIAIFSMIALLAFQYIYFARNQLAEHDGLRGSLVTMCSVFGCRIPLKKAVDKIQLMYTSVQGHANIEGALVVSASYVNKASFVQPYPVLELVLFDMEQRVVMSRQFNPNEYLQDSLADKEAIEAGVPPDTSIQARLEIVDPGKNTVNFEFNFL